ncbi:protein ORF50 [Cyprinid herpesvirus 3]|uniref:Protein ORF50 n=1 Tax=Cyprinid herpesvirus 3 TaxID=180230 RepID=A3QML8_CYHV3|nr:unnamed protein product [Cyprinid herpesvirus 3]ABF81807.1 hypothetical protein [Cyprinid herpesvirus 3]ABG42877.1 protein ORF50 [Cyprinid herpesvirus 3]AJP55539.1 protein ORF50 [Cyprinid herpesvirus 3]AJP55696.1 protein ORF50 [Cyprinid herpesvirus 3]AVL27508.1 protein ORF50 [Cyprinid herpesvirus 3]
MCHFFNDIRMTLDCRHFKGVSSRAQGYFGRALNSYSYDDFSLNEMILATMLKGDKLPVSRIMDMGATATQAAHVLLIKSMFPVDYYNMESVVSLDDPYSNRFLMSHDFRNVGAQIGIMLAGMVLKRAVGIRLMAQQAHRSEVLRLINTQVPDWDDAYIEKSFPVGTFFVDSFTQTVAESIRQQKFELKNRVIREACAARGYRRSHPYRRRRETSDAYC